MKATLVTTPAVPSPPNATWSNALLIGSELVMSGVTARANSGSDSGVAPERNLTSYAQIIAIFGKIEAQLQAVGGNRRNIIKLTVYLTNMDDKEVLAKARQEFFGSSTDHNEIEHLYPCSTLIGISQLAFPELTVEIDALARLDVSL